ncbi:MAG: hypothetical protein ACLPKE_10890 [Streptosporangiaceae bacterium]
MAKLVAPGSPQADGARAPMASRSSAATASATSIPSRCARDAYQIQFSPISNEMSRNILMQFQGLPKSWA